MQLFPIFFFLNLKIPGFAQKPALANGISQTYVRTSTRLMTKTVTIAIAMSTPLGPAFGMRKRNTNKNAIKRYANAMTR